MKVWNIVILSPFTGDIQDHVEQYYNRGHAISALRGLMKRFQTSEVVYAIRRG